ncbi:MAG: SWIM zinc finger family protein [Cyanobacteria bacterium SID2]|nr:SWIM zinc finger family protein [Cyanobacteria bacterium SID2]MBP0005382.1 SWIM zinc finger family protein [Cyanobacteria bacterium SBC]
MNYEPIEMNSEREWWVQQWLDLLEKYRFKKRLERGRNYARQGNVLKIEFTDRKVLATVQGTDPEPYEISLWLDPFSDEDWQYIINTMVEQAIFSAKLLAGEMPIDIENVFAANGLRLFPFSLQEIRSRCSCPDKANPCKHIIAVYHLLGDRFAEDPFVLFQLRGRTKEQIIESLRERRAGAASEASIVEPKTSAEKALDAATFWQYDTPLDPSLVAIVPAPQTETILEVLGLIPFANGNGGSSLAKQKAVSEQIRDYLKQAYDMARNTAVSTAMKSVDSP